ncbi:MAG: hypothetical protein PHW46_06570 [Candidatus Omnitrophica bacterium]|nr:hypothetical protein [Candidatus Omnitrophota bacterium]
MAMLITFLIGWILSPFTWWNDAFINIPLSYLLANLIFYITHWPFGRMIIAIYWLSNVVGLAMMYFSGKILIMSLRNKIKAMAIMVLSMVLYAAVIFYLDSHGKLHTLMQLFEKTHTTSTKTYTPGTNEK